MSYIIYIYLIFVLLDVHLVFGGSLGVPGIKHILAEFYIKDKGSRKKKLFLVAQTLSCPKQK